MITRQSREALGMFISCVGIIALLAGLFPKLLTGTLGLVLVAGAAISAILTVVLDMQAGSSLKKSLLGILIVGIFAFGAIYGLIWYLMSRPADELFNLEAFKGLGK